MTSPQKAVLLILEFTKKEYQRHYSIFLFFLKISLISIKTSLKFFKMSFTNSYQLFPDYQSRYLLILCAHYI